MLTGHVDCECLLTASIHFPLSVCLSFPVGCGVLHRVSAGPHTSTARRDARDGRCGVALFALSSLYLACFPFSLNFLNADTLGKQARIATAKFEGSERINNSTRTAHTHIYMLSRVAAVRAPRTHNRRRMTGSSGRRREGGESEPQRPNMSRLVFTSAVLFLLVVMCCVTCGAAAASTGEN
ncbi:trans-sialidase [Trypanosoma cruzi]|nr:trans-sialidase [Trypanosoma cruzi]